MDVNKTGRVLAVLLLLVTVRLDAQVRNDQLKKEVLIDRAGVRVDSFLNLLSKRTGLGFSFNSKKISPGKPVSLKAGKYTVAQCLTELKRLTGIHYAVMNNHIILVDNPPQEKYRLALPEKKVAPVVRKKVVKKPMVKVVQKDSVSVVVKDTVYLKKDSLPIKDSIPPRIKDSLPRILAIPVEEKKSGLPKLFERDTTRKRVDTTIKQKPVKERDTYKPTGRLKDYNPNAKNFDPPSLSIGVSALRPDIYNLFGVGINLQYENPIGEKWSWTGSVGYHQVFGRYDTTVSIIDTFPRTKDSSIKQNFSQIPLLIGLRYYLVKPVYASFEVGYAIKASRGIASFISIAPSVGLQFPVGERAMDVNFKYLYMMGQPTYDKPRLEKGNFGFWCLRVSYLF